MIYMIRKLLFETVQNICIFLNSQDADKTNSKDVKKSIFSRKEEKKYVSWYIIDNRYTYHYNYHCINSIKF